MIEFLILFLHVLVSPFKARAQLEAENVLEWFMDLNQHADNTKLVWVVGILLAFAVAMLILAWADRVSAASDKEPK